MRSIHAAAGDVRSGRLSPVDLLDECLARIDRAESKVHAWVSVDRDGARAAAKRMHDEARAGRWRGPLHGMPIAIKDIFDVFDWPTAAGSKLWANSVARQDCTVVRKLREAGAVFVGKTVTTQYASFDPPPTRNPWKLDRTPGGSSSGSAAALACGMCLGALGSQTGGSITRPAAYCGVAGLKPTFGRVSLSGIVPLAPSIDHPGPMARSVRDLALMLDVIAGFDPLDAWSEDRPVEEMTRLMTPHPQVPTLARVRGLFEERADSTMRAMMDGVSERLRSAGASVAEINLPASFSEVTVRHRIVMAVEAAAYHEPRLRRHPEDYGPNISKLLEEGLACPAPEYNRCKEHQDRLKYEMESCSNGVTALLTPATNCPAPAGETTGDPVFNSPWSYVGLPTVSIPVGLSADGLPMAIQLVGRRWDEAGLLAAGAWCEDALGVDLGEPPVLR
jgi:aspartyl-tRNA(Asn)/glutamyl-tRNA(Gln) amidotransferase subunit A